MWSYLFLLIILVSLREGQAAYNESDVTYYLSTQQQSQLYYTYNQTPAEFDDGAIIVFLIHGWTESYETEWYQKLTEAFLSRTDAVYNVVQVDWSKPAGQLYPLAVESVRHIGDYIANYIVKLVENGISLDRIEIVGHSLGGQVAGCLGASVRELLGQSLGRITGLDPAGPLYYLKSTRLRLDETDADVVLVIHTDAGGYGTALRCGTTDVYPNGGAALQPGCLKLDVFCSHHKSYEYFLDAVRYGGMNATECDNYPAYSLGLCKNNKIIDIGGNITIEDRGKYYLKTNSQSPYAISQ